MAIFSRQPETTLKLPKIGPKFLLITDPEWPLPVKQHVAKSGKIRASFRVYDEKL